MDLCIITLFNTTADEMGHRLRCVLPLPWRWSLFVQLAGGLPCQQVAPQASSRICRGNSSSRLSTSLLRFALPIQIQLAHAHRACSALMHNRRPLPKGLGPHGQQSHWLVAPLPCGFTLHTHTHTRRGVVGDGVERTRASNATLPCLVRGMPGRPGPGFRLRCVQSVSVTW